MSGDSYWPAPAPPRSAEPTYDLRLVPMPFLRLGSAALRAFPRAWDDDPPGSRALMEWICLPRLAEPGPTYEERLVERIRAYRDGVGAAYPEPARPAPCPVAPGAGFLHEDAAARAALRAALGEAPEELRGILELLAAALRVGA